MKIQALTLIIISLSLVWGCKQTSAIDIKDDENRIFIAHRGVNIRSTIAGENSLEAIRLTKLAGFGAIETDVRLSADSFLVVMHDNTLNRTCLNADGTPLESEIPLKSKTLQELKSNYILKATNLADSSRILTLEEFLIECKRNELYTFIEPKIFDETGNHYQEIIRLADKILGRNNYVVTSNNKANRVIRTLGINDVRLMGILYQTTFEELEGLGNTIMAISASRFDDEEFSQYVSRAKKAGLVRESHADKFQHFDKINNNDINFISTDILAPDFNNQGQILLYKDNLSDFSYSQEGLKYILLKNSESLELKCEVPKVEFGAIYLTLEFGQGNLEVELANQKFTIASTKDRKIRYQPMIDNATPIFRIKAMSDSVIIKNIEIKIVEFKNIK